MTPVFPSRVRASSKVVAVLGMHRSGTSWLAGALEQAGLPLGEVNTQAPRNARGTRESLKLNAIHDAVLESNGGSWRRPPKTSKWLRTQRAELGRYITEMDEAFPTWGFKDPRALLLFDEWERRVPQLIRVGIYRHPSAVFRSLHDRSADFTQDEAMDLWRIYNERLIAQHARVPFPVIRFDVPPDDLKANFASIVEHLGLNTAGDSFYESTLAHHAAADAALPGSVQGVWAQLEDMSSR